jgi:nucleotide-binding universal stress UspA family protein
MVDNGRHMLETLMYSQILVPLDGSEASISGLHEAIKIAKEQGSKVRLLHIVMAPRLDYGYTAESSRESLMAALYRTGKNILEKAGATARQEGLVPECVMFESIVGPAADVIVDQARKWPANLIVMGSHASNAPTHIGTETAEVLRQAQVPVLLVRAAPPSTEIVENRLPGFALVA